MNIVEKFRNHFCTNTSVQNDFDLVMTNEGLMVGIDQMHYAVVVVRSTSPGRPPLKHKTQNMSIECNAHVRYTLNGLIETGVVHILRCLSTSQREKEIFLELASVLIMDGDGSEEAIMDSFRTLRSFFSDRSEVTESELIGLYAELYTICYFHESLRIEQYWQSRDRMKFDFSITDRLKLEVKATTKNTRTHHFRHEQLMTELYEIYVLSYLLRYDDEGLALFDLITQSKKILSMTPKKLLRINYVLKNANEDRLKGLRFNVDYTEKHRHFYQATDIPRFNEITPQGVANAEYDCVLDNVSCTSDDAFIAVVNAMRRE